MLKRSTPLWLAATLALAACNQPAPPPPAPVKPAPPKAAAAPAAPAAPAPQWQASADTPTTAGKFDPASRSVKAPAGVTGVLVSGPYARLAPGRYRVTVVLEVGAGSGAAGSVDVNAFSTERPSNVLARKEFPATAGTQSIELDFDATAEPAYEFRVFLTGAAPVAYRQTTLASR